MSIWEIDFYHRPLQTEAGVPLWELVICTIPGDRCYTATCPQPEATPTWIQSQFQVLFTDGQIPPDRVHVFRPQALSLVELACQALALPVYATRRTPTLKQALVELAQQYPTRSHYTGAPYNPIKLDQPPPMPLDTSLLGNQWQFAALPAGELVEAFTGRMIPIVDMPPDLDPLHLGVASSTPIPGVIIEGGRQSMRLATWIQQAQPVALTAIPGPPHGLILDAGLSDRWIIATFDDPAVLTAATTYEHRKQASQGLHFLLIQPDNSGMTYSGFWLLQTL